MSQQVSLASICQNSLKLFVKSEILLLYNAFLWTKNYSLLVWLYFFFYLHSTEILAIWEYNILAPVPTLIHKTFTTIFLPILLN